MFQEALPWDLLDGVSAFLLPRQQGELLQLKDDEEENELTSPPSLYHRTNE